MKKIEIIRGIIELWRLEELSKDKAFDLIKSVMEKTTTGSNKNFEKRE